MQEIVKAGINPETVLFPVFSFREILTEPDRLNFAKSEIICKVCKEAQNFIRGGIYNE